MPANQIEVKFTSVLTQAFHAIKCASRQKGSLVLLFPSAELIEEIEPLIQSLVLTNGQKTSVSIWPAWEHSPFSPVASSITQKNDRLKILNSLSHENEACIILASVQSWCQPTIPKESYRPLSFVIAVNADLGSRETLRDQLHALGYVKSELVEEPGQYAIRGEIIDLFIPTFPYPFRIDCFDTVAEKIRHFHPETQRTLKSDAEIATITVTPSEEVVFPPRTVGSVLERVKEYCDQNQVSRKVRDPIFENIRSGFLPDNYRTWIPFIYQKCGFLADYLGPFTTLLCYEPEQLSLNLKQHLIELKKDEENYQQPYWIAPSFSSLYGQAEELLSRTISNAHTLVRAAPLSESSKSPILVEPVLPDSDSTHHITEKEVYEWLDDGFFVWIGTRGITHQERLRFLLKRVLHFPGLKIFQHDPGESLQFLSEKTIILSESAFFGRTQPAARKPKRDSTLSGDETTAIEFTHLNDLSVGDFIVHSVHGVGKYLGLHELISQNKSMGEYLYIEYSAGDKLYLPVYRLNTIQKYVGAGGNPSLDKLGTYQFEKAKQKARDSAKKLAINLVEIYAKRALLKGPRFVGQNQDYFDFCDEFEFTETEGQLKSTQDVLHDLESGKLLDRLVCGDVGFGKTEVAMRAAFQSLQSGYQTAVLVPTTLLAFQHEQSFKKRFKNYPVRIESISRFKTKKMQNEIIKELADGKIDILIGTHRLISKDIEFSKLGLLIVDEEHRFGVEHKEKIKSIQANTHTLTLTATPIPRTLNMALSGLKDISIIKTPPTNRQPIKTYVSSFSEELIKSSIETELARGGQVFYLYNRVQTIQKQAEMVQKLVPQARVIVAHGQMSEAEIEAKMLEFYQGHAQILVCTTIIESGIDVPNAGTMIIHRADQLGLAQLYQIRGRVGRSHRKAYAYLLVDGEGTLTSEAKMRLDVLQRFVELGSGFQIASYDLEIRGGGNFLGGEQSGHIASVGLDLFTELLEEAIQELRGQKIDVDERHFEPEIQVGLVCEINPTLVSDSKQRLSLYRKLSQARTNIQVDELYEELVDRYGKLPTETENLFWLIRIKNLLKRVGVELASITANKTVLTVRKTTLIDGDEVMKLYTGPKSIRDPRISITPDSKIIYQIELTTLQSHLFELETLFKKIAPKAFA